MIKKIGSWLIVLVLLFWVGRTIYKAVVRNIANNELEKGGVQIRAVIVEEKNYMGNSPVSQQFSYSYQFSIDGKSYRNDSHSPSLKVGDSINVLYVKKHPFYNKPVKPED